ncbi:MAG: hypothetical protein AAGF60_14820 [Pseudomonadota bacterium]
MRNPFAVIGLVVTLAVFLVISAASLLVLGTIHAISDGDVDPGFLSVIWTPSAIGAALLIPMFLRCLGRLGAPARLSLAESGLYIAGAAAVILWALEHLIPGVTVLFWAIALPACLLASAALFSRLAA